MNKSSDRMIKTFLLNNDDLRLSIEITLLIVISFVFFSSFGHQIQNTEATNDTPKISWTISDLIQKGGEMLNNSKYEEALLSFDHALAIDSRSVDALNGKGLVLNQLGKYEEAITWFDKALQIDPDFVIALNSKGITLLNLGKYEEAITWFDKALQIDPDFIDAIYNKADALGELGRYEEAFVWTDKALTLRPVVGSNSNSKDLMLPND